MVEKRAPTVEELVRMRVVLTVPGMDAVGVRGDLVYKTVEGQPLHMDVYSPPGPPQARPAVILIHGGPIPRLGAKNMGLFVSYGELLATSGFVTVTFNHRFLAPAELSDAAEDVADLVMHIRDEAGSLGIDEDRLALWAFSGGGSLVAAPLRDRPTWLSALVGYYPVLDLRQAPPELGNGLGPEVRESFSAVRSLGDNPRAAPHMLVARAGLDSPWINDGIDRFVQVAKANGAPLVLLDHPQGRHGFDFLDDDERSKQIIRRTIEFLRDHLT